MAPFRSIALLTAGALAPADARVGVAARVSINPIRKVVSMLQGMQKQITVEGEKEAKLLDEFMCYCKTGGKTLQASVDEATARLPQLQSQLEEFGAENVQLSQDIGQAKKDRQAAEANMKEASAIREKEAASFAKASAEQKTNVEAMSKAVAALEKGMGGSFLQTADAAVVSKVVSVGAWSQYDRETLTAFLAGGQGEADGYAAPSSGEIVGILKQMHETMSKDLADDSAEEAAAISEYEGLVAAKTKEVQALSQGIESKTARLGNVGTELVEMSEDIEDTGKSLAEDQQFLKDLDNNCATKKSEWDERSKTRAEELLALADTIKILNDDESLDLFKQTLATPSLMQVQVTSRDVMTRARAALDRKHDARLNLIAMAMRGKKVSFDKVVGMVDEMVSLLKQEQQDDDKKKEYCAKEFDEADDQQKALKRQEGQLEASMADGKEALAALTEDMAALGAGIRALDKQVAEGTEIRKEENAQYKKETAANSAAKELLAIAKNRMNQFYNPKLHKAAPKRELSEGDRIFVNNGGTPPPTEAPGGIAGTGVEVPASLVQVSLHSSRGAPPPPPETFDAYTKKGGESNGVIAMIDLLIKDLDKELTESKVEEQNSQEDYETFMANSAKKRSLDAKTLENKASAKAAAEEELLKNTQEHKATARELMANAEYIAGLHAECDWLVSNFEVRKQARADEVDSLGRAKAVLSGADYSLVQTSAHTRLLRGHRA